MSAITPSANHPFGIHVVSYGSYHDKRGFTRFCSSITRTLRMNSLSRAHRVTGNACGMLERTPRMFSTRPRARAATGARRSRQSGAERVTDSSRDPLGGICVAVQGLNFRVAKRGVVVKECQISSEDIDATSACLRARRGGGARRTWKERNDEEGVVPEKVRACVFSA